MTCILKGRCCKCRGVAICTKCSALKDSFSQETSASLSTLGRLVVPRRLGFPCCLQQALDRKETIRAFPVFVWTENLKKQAILERGASSRSRRSGSSSQLDSDQDLEASSLVPQLPATMRRRQESMKDRFHRFRGVILVISVPLLLLAVVLLMMPRSAPLETYASSSTSFEKKTLPEFKLTVERYAVVFDAGSTGTRVHVYRFDEHMDLMEINGEFELFEKVTPGLSAYKDDPKGAGESIRPLLEKALAVVPKDLQNKTPVRVAATAGLRLLSEAVAEELLDEVRHVLKEYPFRCGKDSVAIMDGADEGAFAWVTVNHLLGNTDKLVKDTVGIVDLGGGSVQMAYAVEEPVARSAPAGYIREVNGKGVRWNVYVHSYLGYGLMAARAAVLSAQISQEGHACLPAGYTGSYEYGGKTFEAIARTLGGSYDECSTSALAALKLDAPCDVDKCSFNGVWHGGGGDGTHKLYIASYFFDRAQQLGIIPEAATDVAVVKPSDFGKAAEAICRLTLPEIAAKYKHVSETDAPFACLDIAYQATLLTKGFTIETDRSITLVKTVKYHGRDVEAAWPLGAAIDIMSV